LRRVAAFVAITAVVGASMAWVSAEAARVAGLVNVAGSQPLPDKRLPGWIAIEKVSDGCGQEGSLFRAHDQTYETDSGRKIRVDFTEACNLHDAAYSGALVWDSINGGFVDFSNPRWTKAAINEKFKHDLQRLCFRAFPNAAAMGAEKALLTCLTSRDVRKFATWGALSFYDIVNSLFGASPRERINITARWKNAARSWPLCDVAANQPMTITQTGRQVTAEWLHGTAGQYGEFRGTFITGGNEGDDVVVGEYTITDGKGGRKVSGGDMTFKVISEDKIDFNGAGSGGTMLRSGRSTQGLRRAAAVPRCKKPAGTTKTAKPAGAASGRTATKLRLTLVGPQGTAWSERDLKTLKVTATPADPTVNAKITETVTGTATLTGGSLAPGEVLFVFATRRTADGLEYVYLCTGKGSCSFTMPADAPGRAGLEEAIAQICAGVPPKTNLGQGCVTSFNLRVDVRWSE
jgi:hypothetical protein